MQVSAALGGDMVGVLTLVADDPTLGLSHPGASRALGGYRDAVDREAGGRRAAAGHVASSLKATCQLLALTPVTTAACHPNPVFQLGIFLRVLRPALAPLRPA